MKNYEINKARRPCSEGLRVELTGGLSTSVVRCFPRIPNIRDMVLEGAVPDRLMSDEGITRNLPRKVTFRLLDRDDYVNKYINHMERRLHRLRIEGRWAAFWAVSNHLIRNSQVFFCLALRQVIPTWYKDWELKKVLALYPTYKRYVRKEKVLTLFRVWIDKTDGTQRPLGVPRLICRLLLYQMNKILQVALTNEIPAYQHAYQPGKGTTSAWQEVIGKVLPAKYIWEFDLRKFFDSIDQHEILRLLDNLVEMQGGFLDLIETHLQSWVDTAPGEEPEQEKKKSQYEQSKLVADVLAKSGSEGLLNDEKLLSWALLHTFGVSEDSPAPVGVPQGANTSPILAILALRELYEVVEMCGLKMVMYADDGIIYSNEPFDPEMIVQDEGIRSVGINFNMEKSHWVKSDGIWERNLKFLGLTYFHEVDKLGGTTRNSSTPMLFDKHDLVKAIKHRDREDGLMSPILAHDLPKNNWGVKWKDFIFSSVLGFIQSRLYEGEWNPSRLVLVDHLKWKRKTWCAKYIKEYDEVNLWNVSSYAYSSLLELLSKRKRHRLNLGSTCEYTFNEEERRYEATKLIKALPPTPDDQRNKEMDKAFQELIKAMELEDYQAQTKISAPTVYEPAALSLINHEENTYLRRLRELTEDLRPDTIGIAHLIRRYRIGRLVRNRAFYDSLPREARREMKLYAEDRELLKGRKVRKTDARPKVFLMPATNLIDPFEN